MENFGLVKSRTGIWWSGLSSPFEYYFLDPPEPLLVVVHLLQILANAIHFGRLLVHLG
jgi:hypothetical protein